MIIGRDIQQLFEEGHRLIYNGLEILGPVTDFEK
jgi:hypothetical protein